MSLTIHTCAGAMVSGRSDQGRNAEAVCIPPQIALALISRSVDGPPRSAAIRVQVNVIFERSEPCTALRLTQRMLAGIDFFFETRTRNHTCGIKPYSLVDALLSHGAAPKKRVQFDGSMVNSAIGSGGVALPQACDRRGSGRLRTRDLRRSFESGQSRRACGRVFLLAAFLLSGTSVQAQDALIAEELARREQGMIEDLLRLQRRRDENATDRREQGRRDDLHRAERRQDEMREAERRRSSEERDRDRRR